MTLPPLLEAMGVMDGPRPRLPDGWFSRAYDVVKSMAASGLMFNAESLRAWAEASGLPPPPDGRAWGSVIALAKRKGLVAYAGKGHFVTMTMAGAKLRPVRYWKSP